MRPAILALNAGSSSLKFGLFSAQSATGEPTELITGSIRTAGPGPATFRAFEMDGGRRVEGQWPETGRGALVERLLDWLDEASGPMQLVAAGHRIVHGGMQFSDPVEVDGDVLQALTPLAPLHQPLGLAVIDRLRSLRPEMQQIACFDTAFHRTMRPPANRYALPRAFEALGIHRYGFHGLSYESIAIQLARLEPPGPQSRVLVAHLGSGASLCAMRDLKSIDTTMGFSTLDGLMMGKRAGSLDPGILLYLIQEKGYSADRLEYLLYDESGLLGVSGISADVAELVASAAPEAAEALDLFAFQVARHSGALASSLGGIDRLVFTGGIGENAVLIECRAAQEELMIARHVLALVRQRTSRPSLLRGWRSGLRERTDGGGSPSWTIRMGQAFRTRHFCFSNRGEDSWPRPLNRPV